MRPFCLNNVSYDNAHNGNSVCLLSDSNQWLLVHRQISALSKQTFHQYLVLVIGSSTQSVMTNRYVSAKRTPFAAADCRVAT
jgi:hypothetical protein